MALLFEEHISCAECGMSDFKEERRLKFHKSVRARGSGEEKLQPLEEKIVYVCAKCGHELQK